MVARRIVMLGMVAAMTVAAAPAAHAVNLFEDLGRAIFGGPRLRATPIFEYDEPMQQRAPRQKAPEVSSKPKPPVVQLDPATDPSWYLKDPTLRRGDIVVTASGVMVYQGGRSNDDNRRADFTALGGKDSKGWKRQLETAAAGGRNFFDQPSAPAKPARTAQADIMPKR